MDANNNNILKRKETEKKEEEKVEEEKEQHVKKVKLNKKRGKLVATSGKEGTGKSTICTYLQNEHGFISYSIASVLKKIVSIIFNWPYEILLADTEERAQARLKLPERLVCGKMWNFRTALQFVGTDLLRTHMGENIFCDIADAEIESLLEQGHNVCVSDPRFANEIEMVQKKGGVLFAVYRNDNDLIALPNEHVSTNEFIKHLQHMYKIPNKGTKEELYHMMFGIINKILADDPNY